MKKLSPIILLILALSSLLAQNNYTKDSIFGKLPHEIEPIWAKSTYEELIRELSSKLIYPDEDCIEGVTILQFRVDTFGNVVEPKIVRSLSNKIDKQLVQLIGNYRFWPGMLLNKKEEFIVNLPIRIRLN